MIISNLIITMIMVILLMMMMIMMTVNLLAPKENALYKDIVFDRSSIIMMMVVVP